MSERPPALTFEGRAMASALRLTIHPGRDAEPLGRSAWAAIVDEFEAVEAAMSRFRESSELSLLNAGPRRVSRRLWHALALTDRARRRTGGRFDPRVARALEHIGFRGTEGRPVTLPPATRHRSAVAAGRTLDTASVDGIVGLPEPVDLGGIGKGLALRWAADRAAAVLDSVLVAGGGLLLEAGGDLVVRGRPSDDGWRVGIEDPAGGAGPLAAILIESGDAAATSSTRINAWRAPDGRPAHHLIDPRTGEPAGAGLTAVTVVARDPAWAEIWSKALFVEGSTGIGPLARAHGLAAWWATADGRFEMTPAARPRTAWLAGAA
jgi:thiamine biosynthesis lipoprotein